MAQWEKAVQPWSLSLVCPSWSDCIWVNLYPSSKLLLSSLPLGKTTPPLAETTAFWGGALWALRIYENIPNWEKCSQQCLLVKSANFSPIFVKPLNLLCCIWPCSHHGCPWYLSGLALMWLMGTYLVSGKSHLPSNWEQLKSGIWNLH